MMLSRALLQSSLLEKGLDAVWKKNEVLASNLANADTPGYKARSVEFESVFSKALGADSYDRFSQTEQFLASHEQSGRIQEGPGFSEQTGRADLSPRVRIDASTSMRMDGNNVDVDREMTELSENAILYDTLSHVLSREIGRLRLIINEGK